MSDPSVIHDIGYQRYSGPRLGRGAGGGAPNRPRPRTAKAKFFPWLVVGIVSLVAVILAAVRSQTGVVALDYQQFADAMSWLVIFFVAVVAPEIVSRDLRSGVLPLYFSRPVRAADYVGAKVAALVTAVWLLLAGPQLIMFLGAAFTTDDGMRGVWDELTELLPGWGYSLLWAIVFAGISLLFASLTGKRAFAAGGIVAVFLMTTPIVQALTILPGSSAQELAGLASPMTLVSGVGAWLLPGPGTGIDVGRFGPVYGIEVVTVVTACLLLLLARYRKVAAL